MKFLCVTILLLINGLVFGQKAEDHLEAKNHIRVLNSSALLVRLSDKSLAIKALEEKGLHESAEKIRVAQRNKNLDIVNAFNAEWNFSSVFFFYSSNSKAILEKNWEEVQFLNSDLEADSSIEFSGDVFYIAEFTNVNSIADSSGSQADLGFTGLVIKDSSFQQLKRPFPYYVRDFKSLPIRRKSFKVVRKMNAKLKVFLSAN